MINKIKKQKDAVVVFFNEYVVHYYSQSSNPWEAAYINCFQKENHGRQSGVIVFTYGNGTIPPGQENPSAGSLPTQIPSGQVNHLETREEQPFFVIYYDISRFNDVFNLLRHCVVGDQSMFVSCNEFEHVWALGNNLRVPVGA